VVEVVLDSTVELMGVGGGLVELKLAVGFPLFRQVQAEEAREDVFGPHWVAYVGRAGALVPPRVKREQKAPPFPRSNARRQLSGTQEANWEDVELVTDVWIAVPEEFGPVIMALLDEEEATLELLLESWLDLLDDDEDMLEDETLLERLEDQLEERLEERLLDMLLEVGVTVGVFVDVVWDEAG
jgi:hypothetical protein